MRNRLSFQWGKQTDNSKYPIISYLGASFAYNEYCDLKIRQLTFSCKTLSIYEWIYCLKWWEGGDMIINANEIKFMYIDCLQSQKFV